MKKCLLALVALFISITNVFAQIVEIDGIKYVLNSSGGTAEVTEKQPRYSGTITIPSEVTYEGRGYAVKSIGFEAFAYCSSLVSVVIPNSVEHIKRYAFREVPISTINIPYSVIHIDYRAFASSNITTIIIPNGVSMIDEYTFYYCGYLSSVTIPSSVQQIKMAAFSRCNELSSIKNLCLLPADLSSSPYVFDGVDQSECTLTVPGSSIEAYENAAIWQDFNIVGGGSLVNPTVNNNLWGFTEGNDLYPQGATATVIATPRTSCRFINWTVNGTVVSTDATYSFTVTEDVVLVANFEQLTYNVSVIINNPDYGTVFGDGDYPQNSVATLTAYANSFYKFEKWVKGGEEITDNPYYLTVTGDVVVYAHFVELPTYTVNLTVNNTYYGSVQGSGVYHEGEVASLRAIANEDYSFEGWYKNGIKISGNNQYMCTITEDIELMAYFVLTPVYTVTVTVNNPKYGSASGGGTYKHGEFATITAVANDGYSFLYWKIKDVIINYWPATFSAPVVENVTVTAYFHDPWGIEDNELPEISIYPNPTSGVLRIESGELRIENVEIFNMMGKVCLVENMRQNTEIVLDVSYLPAGMYFVRITTEDGVVTKKILKQNGGE